MKVQPEKVPYITFKDIKDCLDNNKFPDITYITFEHGNETNIIITVDKLEGHNFPEYLTSSRGVKVPLKIRVGKVTLA